jgi:arsenate reductase
MAVILTGAMTNLMTITIYHNPACGTSRKTLELIRQSGAEPRIIEYLKTPPTRAELTRLIAAMGLTPRQLLREKGALYDELGLANTNLDDNSLLDVMMAHPVLINRPIVVTPIGTRLCRPADVVLEILPNADGGTAKNEGNEAGRPTSSTKRG